MLKQVLLFVGGLLTGTVAGFFIGKTVSDKKFQKQIKQMEDYYQKKDIYVREKDDKEENKEKNRKTGLLNTEERTKIKEKERKYNKKVVDYTNFYEKEEEIEEDIPKSSKEAIDFHTKNKNRPPELISEDQISNIPEFLDYQVLYYFMYDYTVSDEDFNYIDEPGYLLGQVLEESEFVDDDTKLIFVINYQTDCVYEVHKEFSAYSDTHEIHIKGEED